MHRLHFRDVRLPHEMLFEFERRLSAVAAATHHDYYRKTADAWFEFWTRDLTPADLPDAQDNLADRYRDLCTAAVDAEDHLGTVESIQQAIIAAMKTGSYYSTAHKEGGSKLFYRIGQFIRDDYGDDPAYKIYRSEGEFLSALRNFCHMQVSQYNNANSLTDFIAWKLVFRLFESSRASRC